MNNESNNQENNPGVEQSGSSNEIESTTMASLDAESTPKELTPEEVSLTFQRIMRLIISRLDEAYIERSYNSLWRMTNANSCSVFRTQ